MATRIPVLVCDQDTEQSLWIPWKPQGKAQRTGIAIRQHQTQREWKKDKDTFTAAGTDSFERLDRLDLSDDEDMGTILPGVTGGEHLLP
jgi:hypothetical protein